MKRAPSTLIMSTFFLPQNSTKWGMHLTPDHPISCGLPLRQPAREGNHLAEVVGPTAEAHCASWRDGAAEFET